MSRAGMALTSGCPNELQHAVPACGHEWCGSESAVESQHMRLKVGSEVHALLTSQDARVPERRS